MADYQYVAAGEAMTAADAEESLGPYGTDSEPLLLVPPAFSQRDQPVDYAFRDFLAGDGNVGDSGLLQPPGARVCLWPLASLMWAIKLPLNFSLLAGCCCQGMCALQPCVSIHIRVRMGAGTRLPSHVIMMDAVSVPAEGGITPGASPLFGECTLHGSDRRIRCTLSMQADVSLCRRRFDRHSERSGGADCARGAGIAAGVVAGPPAGACHVRS